MQKKFRANLGKFCIPLGPKVVQISVCNTKIYKISQIFSAFHNISRRNIAILLILRWWTKTKWLPKQNGCQNKMAAKKRNSCQKRNSRQKFPVFESVFSFKLLYKQTSKKREISRKPEICAYSNQYYGGILFSSGIV
jgi:hypothetical protein